MSVSRFALAISLFFGLLSAELVISDRARAQADDDLEVLNKQVEELLQAGKQSDAILAAQRALSIAESRWGPEHPEVALELGILGHLYLDKRPNGEAELFFKRSLAILEKALGPDHSIVAGVVGSLALLYRVRGRYAEAEPLYKRELALMEKTLGPDHPDVGTSLNELALLYKEQGRYGEAEPLYKRSLAIREKALDPDHPDVGTSLGNLAALYRAQGRYGEAEPLYKRSLAISEMALGPDHPHVGTSLNNLAELYNAQGRYGEAEPLYKRSLSIREKALGPDHPDVGASLNNLAELYKAQGRYGEAEPLLKRSFAVHEKALGPDHPDVGRSLNNLAELYRVQGRLAEAEPLYKGSLTIREKALGPDHPDVGQSLNNLALLYYNQGRYADAEAVYKRELAIMEKALGPYHPDVGTSLNNLAELYKAQGRYGEAEPLYKRSLAISEMALGPDHPDVGGLLNNLATLFFQQRDWERAADFWRGSTDVIVRRAQRGADNVGQALTGKRRSEAEQESYRFWGLVKAVHRIASQEQSRNASLAVETFETAQWAQRSEAAASLSQMAGRSAKGSPQLAGLVRNRQDLVGEWQVLDKQLIAAKSEPPAERKPDTERALAERLAVIDTRLAEIDQTFARNYPDYAALVSPAPMSVREVQAQLSANEALVLFLDTPEWKPTPEETFVWVVSKSDVRWVRSDLGSAALTHEVAALRCGLDRAAWAGNGSENCAKLLSIPLDQLPSPSQPLPFDQARAHKLYTALFGELQDLVKGKHLLIVPSGALTQLPFQVLVTRPPGDNRAIAWLAREHAISVLPAASSLKALRRVGKPSTAPKAMIGFGNPLLDGPDTRYAASAKLAREKQHCPEAPLQRVVLAGQREGAVRVEMRGGLADVSRIKMQAPLPETADELCAVAHDVKAEARDIRLGAQATEHEIKRLSASGELANYRMVHFATHGVIAGQLDGTHEPGLVLTPPDKATEEDDGYLSASEIAALRLDADWVILSACNTAAGTETSAEALSGLARAFFYAQARALLVSHWEVYSDATVKLITVAIREMARDPKVGRAEALRRSMLALIDKGEPPEAHPAYWAPFVVVGEGAAAR
jgi:CHAT domain-containing protein/tetratricopeptide (TPR) repeat protein